MIEACSQSAFTRCASTKKGFSLIELLVVVFIIGVLSALLLPAVNRMRLQGQKVGTINNMHQLGVALLAYAGEHSNVLPGPVGQGLFKGYTRTTTNQLGYMLAPYLNLPDQVSLGPGQSVAVPQLTDPGYKAYSPSGAASSSVPQFVQKIAYPTTSVFAGRRPLGVSESTNSATVSPLNLLQFSSLRPEQCWVLSPIDQQIPGLTASWKTQMPPKPLYGQRPRLYQDGSIGWVDATDPN